MSQFDTRFTRQTPVDSPDDTALSESANQAFLVRSGGPVVLGTRAGIVTEEWCVLSTPAPTSTRQGFTYVAPSVLDSIREGFNFQPKLRSPRRLNSSPRTPIRSVPQGRGGQEISSSSGSASSLGVGGHPGSWGSQPTCPPWCQ